MQELERKIALFDIDKTAYEGFLLFPLVEAQANEGLISSDSYLTIQETFKKFELRELTYGGMVAKVLEQYANALQGKTVESAVESTVRYLTGEGNRFYPYVGKVIGQLRDTHDVFFVTAEPQFVSEGTRQIFDATGSISTVFSTHDGKFTGDIQSALSSGQHKADAIASLLASHNHEGSFAFGDSEGDMEMLDAVQYAVCVDPSPELLMVAQAKQWFVTFTPENIPGFVASRIKGD